MRPPNYRRSTGARKCANCGAFDPARSWCRMFSLEVDPAYVCDKWEPITEANMADTAVETRRDFSADERAKLAKEGKALPDGSYPIVTTGDLSNAIQAVGRASNPGRAKAHIIKRAKALGATDMLPEDWREEQLTLEQRDPDDEQTCPRCDGTGKVGGETCPRCHGTGKIDPDEEGGAVADADDLAGGPSENADKTELEQRESVRERVRGTVERRSFATDGAEIRSTSDGGLRFSGYASVTETPYQVGGFEETFAKGAFKRSLGEDPDVVLLINHEGLPLARTKSGTMTLSEDARGLKVVADLDPEDPDVRALVPKMRRGDLTEMSFAFKATDDEWTERDSKRLVRSATIHKGDVSVVTHGANSATTAGLRAFVADFEQRAGKRNSKADRAEIEDAIQKLQSLLTAEEQAEEQQVQQQTEAMLKVDLVPRHSVEYARNAKSRLGGRR